MPESINSGGKSNNSYLKVTLSRLDESLAVLLTENNEEIKWPKNKLPDNLRVGDVFYLIAGKSIDPSENKREITKIILEEILNGEEE